LLGTLKGISVAIVVSLVALLHQMGQPSQCTCSGESRVRMPSGRGRRITPGTRPFRALLLLRLEGRVFFFNAEHIGQKMRLLVD